MPDCLGQLLLSKPKATGYGKYMFKAYRRVDFVSLFQSLVDKAVAL